MPTTESVRAEVNRVLQAADSITVVSHYNPDSDAYGSSLGLTLALRAKGKSVTVVNESGIVDRYAVIPGIDTIQQKPGTLGVLVVCDCGAFNRAGDSLVAFLKTAPTIINIDHHISNDDFGHINLVDTGASSTSEIIYDLLSEGGYTIDTPVATCLLAGIIGDTGSFRYSSTTAKTLRVAADLVEKGASPTSLFKSLYGSPAIGAVKLQSECMLNISLSCGGAFAEVIVTAEMISRHSASLDDTDGLAERARDIAGVKVAASIREDGKIWRISLRSSGPEYNVSDIAAAFGGGGHVQAAAFRSSKPLDEIRRLLKEKVEEALK